MTAELRAREATGGAIRALLNLAPKVARRIRDGKADESAVGESIMLRRRLRLLRLERSLGPRD